MHTDHRPADSSPVTPDGPRVGLFVTCLVDLFRPAVGFAAVQLLRDAGCTVTVPRSQTCCGQPALNSGDRATATEFARAVVSAFEGFDYIVAPSGSCAATLAKDVPELLADDPEWAARARDFAARCHELTAFLVDVLGVNPVRTELPSVATYHDSCSGLRALGIQAQPRELLASVRGLTLKPLPETEVCCGFGGTFCVKYPDISNAMVSEKARNVTDTEADLLLGGDLGCLMNIAGKLRRTGAAVRVYHVAEVLAGMGDAPAIGEPPAP